MLKMKRFQQTKKGDLIRNISFCSVSCFIDTGHGISFVHNVLEWDNFKTFLRELSHQGHNIWLVANYWTEIKNVWQIWMDIL